MNCSEVRAHLPGLLYGDLNSPEAAAVENHLTSCPACRRERLELEHVRQALAAVAVPPVRVDLPRLYHQAAERQARRARRWRRTAVALCAVAALLLLVLGLGLEVRLEANQVLLRWGSAPADQTSSLASPGSLPPRRGGETRVRGAVRPEPRSSPDVEERLRLMDELIQAVTADMEARDERQQTNLARIQDQVAGLREQARQHWSETERNVAALYAAQFILSKKGDQP